MSFGSDDAPITMTGGGIYEPAEPFVQDILQESARLYGSDLGREFFPGSTVMTSPTLAFLSFSRKASTASGGAAPCIAQFGPVRPVRPESRVPYSTSSTSKIVDCVDGVAWPPRIPAPTRHNCLLRRRVP